eukprot:TRINITY_DN2782_c0_g1_i1.p1 TRINITY_DN2782_c0_g1~~TRINITY_DN2782_c0_g1_i1.p1  ORF type:complete len:698 (+),score=177.90 TRINITY_DN2782_c0_g1_i1:264-2096(+)
MDSKTEILLFLLVLNCLVEFWWIHHQKSKDSRLKSYKLEIEMKEANIKQLETTRAKDKHNFNFKMLENQEKLIKVQNELQEFKKSTVKANKTIALYETQIKAKNQELTSLNTQIEEMKSLLREEQVSFDLQLKEAKKSTELIVKEEASKLEAKYENKIAKLLKVIKTLKYQDDENAAKLLSTPKNGSTLKITNSPGISRAIHAARSTPHLIPKIDTLSPDGTALGIKDLSRNGQQTQLLPQQLPLQQPQQPQLPQQPQPQSNQILAEKANIEIKVEEIQPKNNTDSKPMLHPSVILHGDTPERYIMSNPEMKKELFRGSSKAKLFKISGTAKVPQRTKTFRRVVSEVKSANEIKIAQKKLFAKLSREEIELKIELLTKEVEQLKSSNNELNIKYQKSELERKMLTQKLKTSSQYYNSNLTALTNTLQSLKSENTLLKDELHRQNPSSSQDTAHPSSHSQPSLSTSHTIANSQTSSPTPSLSSQSQPALTSPQKQPIETTPIPSIVTLRALCRRMLQILASAAENEDGATISDNTLDSLLPAITLPPILSLPTFELHSTTPSDEEEQEEEIEEEDEEGSGEELEEDWEELDLDPLTNEQLSHLSEDEDQQS